MFEELRFKLLGAFRDVVEKFFNEVQALLRKVEDRVTICKYRVLARIEARYAVAFVDYAIKKSKRPAFLNLYHVTYPPVAKLLEKGELKRSIKAFVTTSLTFRITSCSSTRALRYT